MPETLKHFSIYNDVTNVIFYTLSMSFNNFKSDVVKRRESADQEKKEATVDTSVSAFEPY